MGAPFDFPPETAHIRAKPSWHCALPSPGSVDRCIEITGPTDRKMVINALNSGAKTFMADFEGTDVATFRAEESLVRSQLRPVSQLTSDMNSHTYRWATSLASSKSTGQIGALFFPIVRTSQWKSASCLCLRCYTWKGTKETKLEHSSTW